MIDADVKELVKTTVENCSITYKEELTNTTEENTLDWYYVSNFQKREVQTDSSQKQIDAEL